MLARLAIPIVSALYFNSHRRKKSITQEAIFSQVNQNGLLRLHRMRKFRLTSGVQLLILELRRKQCRGGPHISLFNAADHCSTDDVVGQRKKYNRGKRERTNGPIWVVWSG